MAVFALPALALFLVGFKEFSIIFAAVVAFHYAISYDRIGWLLKQ